MYNNKKTEKMKTEKMKTEKMTYEKPTVQKVEFAFKTRIAASRCAHTPSYTGDGDGSCLGGW